MALAKNDLPNIAIGRFVHMVCRRPLTSGKIDTQSFNAVITYVDNYRAEYKVVERLESENVLSLITSGGFSLMMEHSNITLLSME